MPRIAYSVSPADLPAPTTLRDVHQAMFEDRDIRDERQLASSRQGFQAHRKDHEDFLDELEAKLAE